jgi:peptidoglycan/xylan/chitin deacetylase (PgdA/CDA1 family)
MAADGIWYRSVSDAGVWSEWRALDSDYRGLMPDGQSIDDMTGQQWTGQWYVPSTAAADALVGAKPPMSGPGTFTVVSSRTSGYSHTVQWWSMHLLSGSKLFMRLTVASGAFNDWIEVGGAGSSAGARDLRLQLFEEAYPLVSTGNKGVVVLRYDHGLTNFKSTILPLHQQYNLPAYIAMNSRNWSLDENSGATQEEARSWANVEWGNHSADHEDKSGGAAIYDNIVNGRIELEAQLERTIHGYTAPGLTGGQFDGFNTGWVDGYSNTPAGAMILDHHAIASGGIGDTNFRPLDGKIRIGGRHYTWEQRTYAQIKAEIDTAISTKTALTIMAHPRTMNQSGYWTPALLEQVLAYIRSQIDAGNLADLTYYQSQHAVLRTPVEAFQAALA